MQIFADYPQLLQWIQDQGLNWTPLGLAPDGSPIGCIKTGGDKGPAVFISAGSHATEQAGVAAAAALAQSLESDHPVYIIPSRDPIGMNGFAYALGLSLNSVPQLDSAAFVEEVLRTQGEILYDQDDTLLVLIGEYGYATRGLYNRIEKGAPFLEPLKGRRIFFPATEPGIEGTAFCQRAYTLIVTPEAEILHINRFHDTSWAPAEVRCTRQLMAAAQPKLTLDLHEYGAGAGFWFSARHQPNADDEQWEQRLAEAMIGAAVEADTQLAPAEYLPGSFFEKGPQGVFWLIAKERGEGLNLADFAASQYGPSFTIETGMKGSFQHRVDTAVLVARTAVATFAQRYI
ncbi:MAG: hypothetical protein GKR89_11515 [Candidatus Latescibacteria bacterium]|nr:hypothetical protein [Candidatus Latescibacterota bacterium]